MTPYADVNFSKLIAIKTISGSVKDQTFDLIIPGDLQYDQKSLLTVFIFDTELSVFILKP